MLDVDHLVDLANEGARAPSVGRPRKANLSRAVSTAYYAVFHQLLRTVATKFVPQIHWKSRALFYRALEHGRTRDRCKRLGQNLLPTEEQNFFGLVSFLEELRLFATEFVNLQELRHLADYDPENAFTLQEAQDAVNAARRVIANLRAASDEMLVPFLSYLLFGLCR
ncbi:MAG TPA: hypothetical protein VHY79_10665 [Rhizomicrobium sp.]|jgi:uncharacterized protein (UPF0332 family)|nr:hypothetical protein [Rhizomicrobium sp.]